MLAELEGKVAVVTGGGGGLGRAMGERFAHEGMRVVLADVQPDVLDRTVSDLRDDGLEVRGVVTDVSRWDDVVALRDEAVGAYGRSTCSATTRGSVWEPKVGSGSTS